MTELLKGEEKKGQLFGDRASAWHVDKSQVHILTSWGNLQVESDVRL